MSNTTVYVLVAPLTTVSDDSDTVTPAVSLSVIVTPTGVATSRPSEAVKANVSSASSMSSSRIVKVAAPTVWPTVNTAVNGSGTVKSKPAPSLAVFSVAENVTVVAAFTGWSNLAVTVTSPTSSPTVCPAKEIVNVDGSGFSTVTATSSISSAEP